MRARTTAMATLVVAVALAAGAVGLLVTLHDSLVDGRDDAARSRLHDLAALVEARAVPATLTTPGDDEFAQVVDGSGRVVAASAELAGWPPIATFVPAGAEPQARDVQTDFDGEPETYRVWALRATRSGPSNGVRIGDETRIVYVGSSLEAVQEAVGTVRGALVVGLPAMLVLAAIGTWWVVGRALRPVEAIRAEVADITAEQRGRRVPVPVTRDEIARLGTTMNDMLDRLQVAHRREQQFVADAAHELQSPLAAFRVHLEVALTHPDVADWSSTAAELLDDSLQLERLVRDLLFLARLDHGRDGGTASSFVLVDLDDVVLAEAARLRPNARVSVDTSRVSAAPVNGSREQLARLTRNLLENAERYADTVVVVMAHTTPKDVRLTVADDGPGVPTDQAERIFDRFVRLDEARTRGSGTGTGTGLGLAIAREIAHRHGGAIHLEAGRVEADRIGDVTGTSGRGARFVVRLPLSEIPARGTVADAKASPTPPRQ